MLRLSMLIAGLLSITPAVPARPAPSTLAASPQSALLSPSAPDPHVRIQAREVRDSVFEETESILSLAPASQVEWARAYASGAGRRATAREIQAAVQQRFPNDPPGMRAQTHLILQLILMGDIVGALRSHTMQQSRDQRRFSRLVVDKLGEVRRARSAVIRNFVQQRPPRAYAGGAPALAARAQDRSSRYTQFVQVSTQLMGELQTSERELVDMLETMNRDLQSLWQTYAGMRDNDFRASERVLTTR